AAAEQARAISPRSWRRPRFQAEQRANILVLARIRLVILPHPLAYSRLQAVQVVGFEELLAGLLADRQRFHGQQPGLAEHAVLFQVDDPETCVQGLLRPQSKCPEVQRVAGPADPDQRILALRQEDVPTAR